MNRNVLRRAASFGGASPDTPPSPASPFSRNSGTLSASSFGCSNFPSCIHWCDEAEGTQFYEMLHLADDKDHVHEHFHGDHHEHPLDDFLGSSSLVRSITGGNFTHESDSFFPSADPVSRRASAPAEVAAPASETKISSLISAFEHYHSLKLPNSNRAVHLILRGIELKQPASERLSKCFTGHDICVLDIAPKVKFDSDSKSYVHCRPGDCDPNTGNDGMRTLLNMLQLGPSKGKKLLQLIIPRCNIGKRGVAELAQSLAVFTSLRVLEIRENPGVGVHFSVLAQSLQHCSNLKVLNIAACGLGMHGSYVLEAILPRLSQLEELYLTNNYITGVIMERLAPSLEQLTCLQKLFLQQNDLGKQGAAALRKSFARMSSITLLTLDYCVLRAEGLFEIACGLQHLTLLETLRINHNGLGLIKVAEPSDRAVCKQLADALSRMSHLKKVELAQSGFGSEDAMTIAQALYKANSFVEVDDKEVKAVLDTLRKGKTNSVCLAEVESKRKNGEFDDEESQPMRCMLSEVYSHNIVRHQPINKNQCGGCQCPRVSIVANFFKGKHEGVETRRASFIGEKGSYNEHVVMKTVPYPKSGERNERKRLDQELNGLSRVSRDSKLFLELLSISFHYDDWKPVPDAVSTRKCFLSAIVPFCGGGTLCERLYKGLSACAGDHMQSVVALQVTDMVQKFHLALGIAKALSHCHALEIVHSDLCCCNILLTTNDDSESKHIAPFSVKVANTGVLPDVDSLTQRRVYLAPELVSILNDLGESVTPAISSHSSPSRPLSSSHLPHSPLLQSTCSAGGPLHASVPFTKASDVYALGITLLQLFRHTLEDCASIICAVAAEKSSDGPQIPLFPQAPPASSFPPLPALLQNVISSCTRRNPKDRPTAADISAHLDKFCAQGALDASELGTFDWQLLQ